MLLRTFTEIVQEACALFIDAPVTVIEPLPAVAVTTPAPLGHVVATPGVGDTTTFAGSVSVKLMPPCAGLPVPLASVKVRTESVLMSTDEGAKTLASAGCTTVTVWLVTPLVAPAIAVICAAPLILAPSVVPRTVSVITHVAPAATETVLAVKEIPERATAFVPVFAIEKASVVVWPRPMLAAPKALVSVAAAWTVNVAFTPVVSTRCAAVMLPAFVLAYVPAMALRTFTEIVHEACAALIVAPVTLTTPVPAVAVTTPVPLGHVVAMPGVG